MRGGGSLKASLARVFILAKNEQENSDQVIKKRCHAELDSASYHLGVLQGLQGVGLKAQPTVDSHMLSLREGQSPTKQSTCLYGLPRILTNARNDKMAGICERDGLISHKALSPSRLIALSPLAKAAFTMAEILLSLTIIGVVAAITLPSLTGNINERTWNTQRKALYSRMSQAVSLMPAVNGYGVYKNEETDDAGNVTQTAEDTAAETFLSSGLSKVLKINNICDAEHIADCGISSTYTNLAGSAKSWSSAPKLSELNSMFTSTYTADDGTNYTNPQSLIDTKAAAFETANGESILTFYNPYCTSDQEGNTWHYSQPKMCANFIYDLNGTKGPNAVGKDIGFMTVMYPVDPTVVAPNPLGVNAGTTTQDKAGALCQAQDTESRLPNRDELSSMFYNKELIGIASGYYWSGSVISSGESGTAWGQDFILGHRLPLARSYSGYVRCVRR